MTNDTAGFRPALPAQAVNDDHPPRNEAAEPDSWTSLKQEIISLYEAGQLGPFTVEDLFEAYPELRSA